MSHTKTSRYISYILRHNPQAINLRLDPHGWANVDELIAGVSKTRELTREILEEIVATDSKQRYAFNDDKTLIRANQGHSINVDIELEKKLPPDILYHGTAEKYAEAIDREGLSPQSRLYVHLSADPETARDVGSRHGKPVIYLVHCESMVRDGYDFFLSANHVWLTKCVPAKYLEKLS